MHRVRWALAVVAVWLLIAGAAGAGSGAPRERAVLGQRLASRLAMLPAGEQVAVRVSLADTGLARGSDRRSLVAERQGRVLATLPGAEFRLGRRYASVSGFAGRASRRAIEALLDHPEVLSVHLDGAVHANLTQGRALIGASTAHALGFTGVGVNVAVLDTGIDTDHVDFLGDIVAEACFCDDHPSPMSGCCPGGGDTQIGAGAAEDDNGHGTSVAGIITRSSGVAPDSGVVALKVLAATGSGVDSDIDAALDWVLTNYAMHSIRVVNLSLSDGGEYSSAGVSSCSGNPSANAIRDLAAVGVVTFAASGNDGHDNGISSPACSPDAISVGGVYDAAVGAVSWCGNADCTEILCTDASGADVFVCHSNSDELLDLLAPDWRTTTSNIGGGTTSFGGTSAASPYAAAQAALLLEADPLLTPAEIRTRMKSFGPMVTNAENALSFRRTDLGAAIQDLVAECGNAILDSGEACDDGNTADGDCCSSSCQLESAGSVCDDGTACTELDACDGAGTCIGTAIACSDADACTDDGCDPVAGCTFTPNTAPCDDGTACTELDACDGAGTCMGTAIVCADADVCTDDGCDPVAGCTFTPNTAPCDDGTACTELDACDGAGTCMGIAIACSDANVCTDDGCDPVAGCTFTPNTAPCDDGAACTEVDTCDGGGTCAGTEIVCDDFNVCTAEACDEVLGCTHARIPGCGTPVPAAGGGGRLAVVLLAMLAGALLLRSGSAARR